MMKRVGLDRIVRRLGLSLLLVLTGSTLAFSTSLPLTVEVYCCAVAFGVVTPTSCSGQPLEGIRVDIIIGDSKPMTGHTDSKGIITFALQAPPCGEVITAKFFDLNDKPEAYCQGTDLCEDARDPDFWQFDGGSNDSGGCVKEGVNQTLTIRFNPYN